MCYRHGRGAAGLDPCPGPPREVESMPIALMACYLESSAWLCCSCGARTRCYPTTRRDILSYPMVILIITIAPGSKHRVAAWLRAEVTSRKQAIWAGHRARRPTDWLLVACGLKPTGIKLKLQRTAISQSRSLVCCRPPLSRSLTCRIARGDPHARGGPRR